MPKSTLIPIPRIRAALILRGLSIAEIARKHQAPYQTCYAALGGLRPGRDPRVRKAVKEIHGITRKGAS